MKDKKIASPKKQKEPEDLVNDKSSDFLLKHTPFIEEYIICLNGTQAWQIVHPGTASNVAATCASRLLRNANIKRELERRFKENVMSKNEVLERLRSMANATLHPFIKIESDGHVYFNFADKEAQKHIHLIRKIKSKKQESYNEKTGQSNEEKWIEVELHDAMKAVELIGKYHALFTDRTESNEKKTIRVTIKKEE